jgi:uncharacterized glyoxalase superfamily metalloenzyme YdcJ
MGDTRRNLQAQPKIQEKIIETPNQTIRTKIFLKKTMFRTLKVQRSQKEPVSRLKGKKVIRITKFADRRQTAAADGRKFFFRLKSLFHRKKVLICPELQ